MQELCQTSLNCSFSLSNMGKTLVFCRCAIHTQLFRVSEAAVGCIFTSSVFMLSPSEVFGIVGPNQAQACCMYTAKLQLVF